MKMKITWDSGVTTLVEVANSEKLAKNFTVGELANVSSDDTVKMISTSRSRKFLQMLQMMRDKFGSMRITSNYRTLSYNRKVGGDAKSRHLYAEAADWYIGKAKITKELTENVTAEWQKICHSFGEVGAINYYTNGYHLEIGTNYSYGNKAFVVRNYIGKAGDW